MEILVLRTKTNISKIKTQKAASSPAIKYRLPNWSRRAADGANLFYINAGDSWLLGRRRPRGWARRARLCFEVLWLLGMDWFDSSFLKFRFYLL